MATPMTADQLVRALRAEGVRYREHRNWRSHNRNHKGAWGPVHGVYIHHTAGVGAGLADYCYNGNTALPGPICHAFASKTATLHLVGHGRANHAGSIARNAFDAALNEEPVHPRPDADEPLDGNRYFYGLEIENKGDGKDPYPDDQYDQSVRWAAAHCRHHGWSADSVIGHKEATRRKIDPSFSMGRFRADVAERLTHPASWSPDDNEPAPPPAPEEDPVPLMLSENNEIDVTLKSGVWTGLAMRAAAIHTGPRRHSTLVHLLLSEDTPDGTVIEGRFFLTDTKGSNASHYLATTVRGGGGHQFCCTGDVSTGRQLRFQVRATTPAGAPVTLLHRSASGPYWAL